jgi:Delta7-sterol 5-desaturase
MTIAPVPPPDLGPAITILEAAHSGRMARPPQSGGLEEWLGWAGDTAMRTFATDFLYYFLGAGLIFLLLWVVLRRRLAHRRIESEYPEARHIRREILFSIASVGVYALIGVGLTFAALMGWTRLYIQFDSYGWAYWLASLAALIVLHDAYFYWTHRAMHHRSMFKWFHRLHHRSHNPSPWAAYAFAPAEAFVQGLFLTITAFVLPLHPTAIMVFLLHQILRNALGHSGFEIFPGWWQSHPILKWINTTSHHHLHHSKGRGNYGLYFLWWDRLMGTEHAESAATFARASAKREAETALAPAAR